MEYLAKIYWLTKEQGGRLNPIPMNYDKYAPLIRIAGETQDNNWSILVNNFELIDSTTTFAKVSYLFPENAPNNLMPGIRFELYEGRKLVACGEILKEC